MSPETIAILCERGFSAGELEGSGRAPLAPEWASAACCTSPRRTRERSEVNETRQRALTARAMPYTLLGLVDEEGSASRFRRGFDHIHEQPGCREQED